MSIDDLKNLLVFMKRVPVTGEEALAWTQTYTAVQKALQEALAVKKSPAP